MMIPTIHLNGTSKQSLIEGYCKARSAVVVASDALRECYPNGRDYYPQGVGALKVATNEHSARITKMSEVLDELTALIDAIDEA